jgi:hypothetical protein
VPDANQELITSNIDHTKCGGAPLLHEGIGGFAKTPTTQPNHSASAGRLSHGEEQRVCERPFLVDPLCLHREP